MSTIPPPASPVPSFIPYHNSTPTTASPPMPSSTSTSPQTQQTPRIPLSSAPFAKKLPMSQPLQPIDYPMRQTYTSPQSPPSAGLPVKHHFNVYPRTDSCSTIVHPGIQSSTPSMSVQHPAALQPSTPNLPLLSESRTSAPPMSKSLKPTTHPRHPPSHSDPVLPRNSRVRIVGNNRTKWDLIGRVGVVRAAQTLGGWHEVQLTDGGIVRVQRNALTVLELPAADGSPLVRIESGPAKRDTAHSTQPYPSHSIAQSNTSALPNIVSQHKVSPPNGRTSPHKEKSPDLRPSTTSLPASHPLRKRPRSKLSTTTSKPLHANISKLNMNSLRRYRSVYNLNVASDCSKDELVGAVSRHFQKVTVNETEVIANFLRYLARRSTSAAGD